jgi:hypothetical protein
MVSMKAALASDAYRLEVSAVGKFGRRVGARGVMAKEILPEEPAQRRRRSRLYALRAMDRLGLLGEENLIPTLARRPALRWLADEEGARWGLLTELGRIGEPEAFEEAVRWVLGTGLVPRKPRPRSATSSPAPSSRRGSAGQVGRSRDGRRRTVRILVERQGRRRGAPAYEGKGLLERRPFPS